MRASLSKEIIVQVDQCERTENRISRTNSKVKGEYNAFARLVVNNLKNVIGLFTIKLICNYLSIWDDVTKFLLEKIKYLLTY
ncbi:hypothetical protein HZS_6873 [Henneguya salminicola]|nr:hypothetical protein HZS_6873 [Henneguya salminicola]